MIIPLPQDAIHKAWLYRLLTEIVDDIVLMKHLRFKGGTCAAMLGRLNRFSIDLDFDLISGIDEMSDIKKRLENHFFEIKLSVKSKSTEGLQYFLKYDAPPNKRNTIKFDSQFPVPVNNTYESAYFSEIDRTIPSHTIETMFANKLVAILDRWDKNHSIAGRDLYDIHYFFMQGYRYNPAIIEERCNVKVLDFFQRLIDFIEKRITQTIIQQDLNPLLPKSIFTPLRKTLKRETIILLRDELQRLRV